MDQIKVHFIQIQIRNQITTTIHPTTDGFPNRAVIPQEIRWVFCNVCPTKNFFQMSSQLLNDLTGYDGDIPAFIPKKYFLMVNFEAL